MEVWSSGGVLRTRGRGGVEVWRCAAGEVNVVVLRNGDLKLGRRAAGAGTWRRRGMEVWRCAVGV